MASANKKKLVEETFLSCVAFGRGVLMQSADLLRSVQSVISIVKHDVDVLVGVHDDPSQM